MKSDGMFLTRECHIGKGKVHPCTVTEALYKTYGSSNGPGLGSFGVGVAVEVWRRGDGGGMA